jgi:PAS domain S-box-containing protein
LGLLLEAGELADGIAPPEEVVPRLLDLVVPALAECCVVYRNGGEPSIVGARAAGPAVAGLAEAIQRRAQPPALPAAARLLDAGELAEAPLPAARSGVWVPLRARGRITGCLALFARSAGRYTRGDLRYLQVFAGRLAVALDNARLVGAERRLDALVAGMEDAVTVMDADGRIVMANDAAARLLGAASVAELIDTAMAEVWQRYALFDPDGRPLAEKDFAGVQRQEGRRGPPRPMLVRRVDRSSGEQRWLLAKASVLHDDAGLPASVMYITEDVTAEKRAELGQRLLVEAGRLLSSPLEIDAALRQVAELIVPGLADWCAIDVAGLGGYIRLAALAHVDRGRMPTAQRLGAAQRLHRDDTSAVPGVIRTGVPVRLDYVADSDRGTVAGDKRRDLLESLGLSALLIVPLRSGDDVLGALTLGASQAHRRFDDADQEVAEALASRVADALRNARLLRDRADIAYALSAGLRPEASPAVPGCEVAAVYRPAGDGVEAGGDFYDVIDAPAGSIIVMGDVVGKGAPAAALSAVSRVTLLTAGRLTGEPRAALDELNQALRRRDTMSLCTVVAVALPTELPGSAEVVLAGHPPPLLVRNGVAQPVGEPGPLLGAVDVAEWRPVSVELAPGDVLVLYTDGVLDSVLAGGERFGEARLQMLAERAGADVEALAASLEGELERLRLRDDVALLAIRCPGPPPLLARGTLDGETESLLELSLPGGPTAPRAARTALAEALGGRLSDRAEGDALIIVSELVTNAIRHGGARAETEAVGIHAALHAGALRLEVTDPGPGFEPGGHGPRADGGYGLHLLDRLATRWGVTGSEPVTVWVELDSLS